MVAADSDSESSESKALLDWSSEVVTGACGITARLRLNQAALSKEEPATVLQDSMSF